jgi:acyl-CoA synthetase (AMP-forming)/AMP-acid ligase II
VRRTAVRALSVRVRRHSRLLSWRIWRNALEHLVLEAYGLTEAAHQVASNPLPPRPHKPGTVGFGTGVEIAIIDETGQAPAAESSRRSSRARARRHARLP